MQTINFEPKILSAQQRLQAMRKLANNSSTSSKALQDEAIAEFSITLEELHVATEELQAQNEELVLSRQALELEHHRYQELFDFAPDGYLVTNPQGVIQLANCAATSMFNLRLDLLIGKPLIVFVDKLDQIEFHTQLSELMDGNPLIDWEVWLKPRDKPAFSASISVSTIYFDPQGYLRGFRWLIRDLSQRKQHEQRIAEQAALLNVATDAILVRDLDNQILFWNQSAEKLYGWTTEEVIGKNISDLLSREPLIHEAIQDELVIKDGEWRGELQQITKDGKELLVESHWTLVRDDKGKPKSILIVNTDITQKKQLELQLFQCQCMESLGTLSSGIAHDLNNILTPILSSSNLILNNFPDIDNQVLRLTSIVNSNAKQATELVRQIQLFAQGSVGEKKIVFLQDLISDIEILSEQLLPNSIRFYTEISANLEPVMADPSRLNQVLTNLCVNARDAMSEGGTLSLHASNYIINEDNVKIHPDAHIGSYIVITVVDSGHGISPEIIGRIFDPFFSTKEVGKGSGLGLSIVSSIVRSHGGFINVSSQLGKGTQFEIFLPSIPSKKNSQKENSELPMGNSELVLVVDDDTSICETTKLMLEMYNYQVITAKNGIEAISLYRQHQENISVVLMDMMMPSMDGETAILELNNINPQVRVIASSGLQLNTQFQPDVGMRYKALLPKPYTLGMLLRTINEVINYEPIGG